MKLYAGRRIFVLNSKCFNSGNKDSLHTDHIYPKPKDGFDTLRNLQIYCGKRSQKKSHESQSFFSYSKMGQS